MSDKVVGWVMFIVLVILIVLFFNLPKCDFCEGVLLSDVFKLGKYQLHKRCYIGLSNSYPIGCPNHGMDYGTLMLDNRCEKCLGKVKTWASGGEVDQWVMETVKQVKEGR